MKKRKFITALLGIGTIVTISTFLITSCACANNKSSVQSTLKVNPSINVVEDDYLTNFLPSEIINSAEKIKLITQWIIIHQVSNGNVNITITNMSHDNNDGTIEVNYYIDNYDQNKYITKLIGFKTNKKIENNTPIIDNIGKPNEEADKEEADKFQNINGLSVNKYIDIIKELNISNKTRINTIDLQLIKNKYPNVDLNFKSADQSKGECELYISGHYSTTIIPENSVIKITGFNTKLEDYNLSSYMMNINELDLNWSQYMYDNQSDITYISNWTEKEFSKYISVLNATKFDNYVDIIDYLNNSYIEFDKLNVALINNKIYIKEILVNYINYKWENNKFVPTPINKKSIVLKPIQSIDKQKYCLTPSKTKILEIILNDAVELIDNYEDKYASYFVALIKSGIFVEKNLNKLLLQINVNNPIVKNYASNMNLRLQLYNQNIFANKNGDLIFTAILTDADDLDEYAIKQYHLNNLKTSKSYVDLFYDQFNNLSWITHNSFTYNKIVQFASKHKDKINNLKDNQSIQFTNINSPIKENGLIFDSKNKIEYVDSKGIEYSLFNKKLATYLNSNGVFDDTIGIRSIYITTSDTNLKTKIIKKTNSLIYEQEYICSISFEDDYYFDLKYCYTTIIDNI